MRDSFEVSVGIRPGVGISKVCLHPALVVNFEFRRLTQASKSVDTVNVHRTTTADTLPATSPEGQGWVDFVLDSDQCIQHHWSGLVQVEGVGLHPRLGSRLVWVPSVDVEGLDLRVCVGRWLLDGCGLALWDRSAGLRGGLAEAGDGLDSGRETTAEETRPKTGGKWS